MQLHSDNQTIIYYPVINMVISTKKKWHIKINGFYIGSVHCKA